MINQHIIYIMATKRIKDLTTVTALNPGSDFLVVDDVDATDE